MDVERARAAFAELKQVSFDQPDRDQHHVLTDPLEITAVAIGMKPAYLGGQSHSDREIWSEVAAVATRLGMQVKQTAGIRPFAEFIALDPPPIDRDYLQHFLDEDAKKGPPDDPVLWLYTDPSIAAKIEECERGKLSSADVLGYPDCCVDHFLRLRAASYALKLEMFRRDHGAQSLADYLQLETQDIEPSQQDSLRMEKNNKRITRELGESIVRFPFIHFTACPTCRTTLGSPAVKINMAMRELAVALDRGYARQFERYAAAYRRAHQSQFGPIA